MKTTSSLEKIQKIEEGKDFMTKHDKINKRFVVLDQNRNEFWSPSNVIL